jgi:hypothetical protein
MSVYFSKSIATFIVVLTSACASDSDTNLNTSDLTTEALTTSICTLDMRINDVPLSQDGNPFGGFSLNVIKGPRDCGGTRVSREVVTLGGNGSCAVVADGSFLWANELCAHNPNLIVGNSDISAACQAFFSGGSDLGDHDCRYIVHAGAGPSFTGLQCQPAHVTRVVTSCAPPPPPPPPPLCPSNYKCCEPSDDHTSCDLCWPKNRLCP